ncbi:hypothetical protein EJ08DRAFT_165970 [Tothia fuscella]|uniref:BTB domain-containing protein n=1 Tax=Tothia fuscella TaxID=1048955 RepID=A0A9P4NUW5_9PEZI|nr:hypothetical protein EJ08DRAFT_165970 [Tothia fuscella]
MATAPSLEVLAPPLFRFNVSQDIVTVEIGPDREAFHVHKDLLTACSPYFKAAFEGGFKEAAEKSIHIDEVTPDIFKEFLDWLYSRRLRPSADPPDIEDRCSFCQQSGCSNFKEAEIDSPYERFALNSTEFTHVDLYIFGDRCLNYGRTSSATSTIITTKPKGGSPTSMKSYTPLQSYHARIR